MIILFITIYIIGCDWLKTKLSFPRITIISKNFAVLFWLTDFSVLNPDIIFRDDMIISLVCYQWYTPICFTRLGMSNRVYTPHASKAVILIKIFLVAEQLFRWPCLSVPNCCPRFQFLLDLGFLISKPPHESRKPEIKLRRHNPS